MISAPGLLLGGWIVLLAPAQEAAADAWPEVPNGGYGLLHVGSRSPFASLRSGFAPSMPTSLTEGMVEVRLAQSWVKEFTAIPTALIDFEALRTEAAVSWAFADPLTLHVEIDTSERTPGGALGRVASGFHRAFGVRDFYKAYPPDFYRFQATQPARGISIDLPATGARSFEACSVVSLEASLTPGSGSAPRVACGLGLRRELARGDLRGGAPVDVSGWLSAAKTIGAFVVYAGADVEWFGQERVAGVLPLRSLEWSVLLGVEWRCASRFSVVGSYLVTRGAVPRQPEFSLPANEVAGGIRWELSSGVLLGVALLENVVNPYNTPDFGVQIELSVRW